MARVFVAEDDPRLFAEVSRLLALEGFDVVGCVGFANVAGQILAANPDCVLMDAMLPGIDGRMVCRELRRSSDVPVIMLTCLDSEFDEVTALNLGADDYITKPYRPAVLVAHIQAALRRKKAEGETSLEYGGVTLDVATTMVRHGDAEAQLTRNEARILAILMRAGGAAVSRQEIMCDLWESDAFVDDNTLTVNVNRLRRALESVGVGEDFIKTRRGTGYSL